MASQLDIQPFEFVPTSEMRMEANHETLFMGT